MNRRIAKFLARLRQHVSLAWLRWRGRKIVHVLHIGKTGGTAVKAALRGYRCRGDVVITLNPHSVRLQDIPPGDRVVFFLRDPIARFVSGFLSRQRKGQPRYYTEWSPAEKAAFERFPTPNALALALSSDDPDERRAAQDAMRTIEHVRDSYMRWFGSIEYFESRLTDVALIGFQETLKDDFTRFKRMFGLPHEIALPSDPVKAHRNPETQEKSLDARALDNLRQWYRADLDFLGLCRRVAAGQRD